MGNPLLDAILRRWRKDLFEKSARVKPLVSAFSVPGKRSKGFDFASQYVDVLPGIGAEADWQAYAVFLEDGAMNIDSIEFHRSIDFDAADRIYVVWVGEDQSAFAFHYNLQYSDDGGVTWSAMDSLNVSTTVPPLGRSESRFGGIIVHSDKVMAYSRGLVATGADPPARKIYKSVWDAVWTGPVLWHSVTGHNLFSMRPLRSRDRSVAGMLYGQQQLAVPNRMRFFYAPLDANGNATAHEEVADSDDGDPTNELSASPALAFNESNEAVVLFLHESLSEIWYKVRTGGAWPAEFTKVALGDVDAPVVPEAFRVIFFASTPTWGGGQHLANGDAHALRDDVSEQDAKFVYRKRESGVWSAEDVDFASVDDSSPQMSGAGSEFYSGEHWMGPYELNGRIFALVWMTSPPFPSFPHPWSLWFVTREI